MLHILLFDKAYNVTYWVNYSELRARLRRRYSAVEPQDVRFHERSEASLLAVRLAGDATSRIKVKSFLLNEEAPVLFQENLDLWLVAKHQLQMGSGYFQAKSIFWVCSVWGNITHLTRNCGFIASALFLEVSTLASRSVCVYAGFSLERTHAQLICMVGEWVESADAMRQLSAVYAQELFGCCVRDCSWRHNLREFGFCLDELHPRLIALLRSVVNEHYDAIFYELFSYQYKQGVVSNFMSVGIGERSVGLISEVSSLGAYVGASALTHGASLAAPA